MELILLSPRALWGSHTAVALTALLSLVCLPLHGSGTPVVPGGGAVSQLLTQQGSGAPTDFGDYIAAGTGGLDSPHSYWVEVPAGVSCLAIDIFDADLGAGADDLSAQRDRPRGAFNTSVAYSLTAPNGAPVATSFTAGNSAGPGDNAWLSLYRSSGSSLGTFGDTFSTGSYSNNDGTLSWAGSWIETGDDGSPSSGNILITGGRLSVRAAVRSITRSANLAAENACQAVLTFDLVDLGTLEGNDCVDIEVSGDGGSTFSVLERFCDDTPATTVSYDISTFIATDTRVRFAAATGLTGTGEAFAFDNVQIELFGAAIAAAGHWQVDVDMSSTVTTGDDVNAFGIRAHDGNPGAGGTELEIYSDSFYPVGINSGSRSYDYFPFVTSGCSGSLNNFDWDATGGSSAGSLDLTSRLGSFTSSAITSVNNTWNSDSFSGWTDENVVDDYGIWDLLAAIDDTGTANFGIVYLGGELATAPPPSALPEAETFRIYLPTDAGGPPAKPHLAQFLTHLVGPNPPVVGNTTTVQVTVRVTNPASSVGSIVFSAAGNVVTARVPGGAVSYAGGAAVSSGTIVSQPAAGGFGDVVWNPGTVAPGSVEVLTYRLDVTPPTAGSLAVTGAVGSGNGTRARWLDETGNTTQARATFDFGELCPLSVDTALATHAVVSRFDVISDGHDAVVEWETRSEAGTLGFALFRWSQEEEDWIQVHDDLLVALLDAPQGGVYRFRDAGALTGEEEPTYVLVEVDSAGRQTLVETSSRWLDEGAPLAVDRYEHTPHRLASPLPSLSTPQSVRPPPTGLEEKARGRRRAKVTTTSAGVTFVSVEDLSIALGEAPRAVRRRLERYGYTVSSGGREVSWLAERDGSGLYFYSEAIDSPFSDDNVYWITRGQGRPMAQRGVRAPGSPSGETFVDVRHEEVEATPVLVLPLEAESDFWFWGGLRSGTSASFSIQAPGAVGTGRAALTAFLQGATDSGAPHEHHVEILLNGAFLGETSWSGIRAHNVSLEVDAALLQETDNLVEVAGIRDAGAPQSIVFVDSFDLSYERRFIAEDGELAFAPAAGSSVTIEGLPSPELLLFELADPGNPAQLVGFPIEAVGTTYELSFEPDRPGARHVALSVGAVRSPARVEGREALLLHGSRLAADYLLIVHPSLLDAAERLAESRRRRGLRSVVLGTDDIYDSYSDGIADPRAFRRLLTETYAGPRRGPRYVALVGTGTFDYRDLLGQGDNLVPPLLVSTESGLFASDNRIADLDGDGRPDFAVARIPVRDATELDAFVDKLLAYEAATGAPWRNQVILAADRPSQGVRFEAASERAALLLPPSAGVDRIYLAEEELAAARGRLFARLAGGASLVHYLGHGGIERLGAQGLLLVTDVQGLDNRSLPLVTALTCTVNRFEVPGYAALGEELVRHPGGGAVAVWSASGLSDHFAATELGEAFLERLAGDPHGVLGDAVVEALAYVDGSLASLYVLLGDPATEVELFRP